MTAAFILLLCGRGQHVQNPFSLSAGQRQKFQEVCNIVQHSQSHTRLQILFLLHLWKMTSCCNGSPAHDVVWHDRSLCLTTHKGRVTGSVNHAAPVREESAFMLDWLRSDAHSKDMLVCLVKCLDQNSVCPGLGQ